MKNELLKRIFSSLILIPLSLFFIIEGSFYFIFFLWIIFLFSSLEWINMNKNIVLKILGIIFLSISLFSTYYFREKAGIGAFLFVIIICLSTDVGGYIFGKLFKGPKLIKISPNKTYSGMIGSFLFALSFSYLFEIMIDRYIPQYNWSLLNLSDLSFIIIIILISMVSQIGDLIISYFKRLSKVKNTGKIIPGHGGLLDRIDGMIFALPFSYFILYIYFNMIL